MRFVIVVLALCVMVVGTTRSFAATPYPIKYVLENIGTFTNTVVTVQEGVVMNSQVHNATSVFDKIKGEFDLQDESKSTIHVLTTGEPPPNGRIMTVTGTLSVGTGTAALPVLTIKGGFQWPDGVNPLYLVLAVLVILAIVLVILLVRGTETYPKSPPPLPQKVCPHCLFENVSNAVFCQGCGKALETGVEPPKPPKPTTNNDDAIAHAGTTVMNEAEALFTTINNDGGQSAFHHVNGNLKQKIGRNGDIVIKDDTVSGEHAFICWKDGVFYLQDDGSKNGTLVNGQKIVRQALNDGDEVQFGRVKMRFTILSNTPALV